MFEPILALSQTGAVTSAGDGVSWNQLGPMGAVAGTLLTLFGWLLKRLVDNVLKQNAQVMQLQLTKLDEIKTGLSDVRNALIGELANTQAVLNQLSANVVQELEALRTDVVALNAHSRQASSTDTPLPVARRSIRFTPTPVIGTVIPGLTPRMPPTKR